jgi:hypothetical protein
MAKLIVINEDNRVRFSPSQRSTKARVGTAPSRNIGQQAQSPQPAARCVTRPSRAAHLCHPRRCGCPIDMVLPLEGGRRASRTLCDDVLARRGRCVCAAPFVCLGGRAGGSAGQADVSGRSDSAGAGNFSAAHIGLDSRKIARIPVITPPLGRPNFAGPSADALSEGIAGGLQTASSPHVITFCLRTRSLSSESTDSPHNETSAPRPTVLKLPPLPLPSGCSTDDYPHCRPPGPPGNPRHSSEPRGRTSPFPYVRSFASLFVASAAAEPTVLATISARPRGSQAGGRRIGRA